MTSDPDTGADGAAGFVDEENGPVEHGAMAAKRGAVTAYIERRAR